MWTKFTHMITMALKKYYNKIMTKIKQLPEEVYNNNNKCTSLREATKEELLELLVSHMQGACLDKIF